MQQSQFNTKRFNYFFNGLSANGKHNGYKSALRGSVQFIFDKFKQKEKQRAKRRASK